MRIIKKYKNRIMYDTHTSKPVTLKQLVEMVKNNIAIKILDNSSGKDITRVTILQAMLALEKSGKGFRNIIPDLLAWTVDTSKPDFKSNLKEIIQGKNCGCNRGQAWVKRLVQDLVKADLIPSDKENQLIETIVMRLNEFYDEIVNTLEDHINDRIQSVGKLLSSVIDADAKSEAHSIKSKA